MRDKVRQIKGQQWVSNFIAISQVLVQLILWCATKMDERWETPMGVVERVYLVTFGRHSDLAFKLDGGHQVFSADDFDSIGYLTRVSLD